MEQEKKALIQDFVQYAVRRLNLKKVPSVQLIHHEKFSQENGSLGCYNIALKKIQVVTHGRLAADIMRTLAHELVHRRQDEMGIKGLYDGDDSASAPFEMKANAVAGILLRDYGKNHKQIFSK